MNYLLILSIGVSWLLVGLACWLGWQLLRQNGSILLRLDALEERFDELDLDSEGDPHPQPLSHRMGEGGSGGNGKSKSLARSRINRDGLKAGTRALNFRLPRLEGGELSLEELRGRRVLLVFSDPH